VEEVRHGDSYYFRITGVDGEGYREAGAPQLYRKSFMVAVPPGGEFNIQVKFREVTRHSLNYPLEPVPRWEGEWLSYERIEGEYRVEEVMRYEVSEVYQLGYWEVVRVSVYPISYGGDYIELAGRVEVKVEYGSNYQSGVISSPSWDRIMSGLVINPEYLEIFKLPRDLESGIDQFRGRQPYYRISVLEDGIYELRGSDLEGAGVDLTSIDPSTIRMMSGPSEALSWEVDDTIYDSLPLEVPILLYDGGDGRFDSGDRIVWYGQSITGYDRNSAIGVTYLYHSPWSDTGVYWLTWGGQSGARIDSVSSHSPGGAYYQSSFADTIHLEKDSLNPSQSGLRFIQNEFNRSSTQSSVSLNQTLRVPYPADSGYLSVHVYTSTSDSHHLRVRMNNTSLGEAHWIEPQMTATNLSIFTFNSSNRVSNGDNSYQLEVFATQGGTEDLVMYDQTDLIYQREYRADGGQIIFGVNRGVEDTILGFELGNLNSSQAVLLNIDNPYSPQCISGWTATGTGLDFAWPGDSTSRFAAGDNMKRPVDIRSADPEVLKTIMGADYLIITHRDYRNVAERLASYRINHYPGGIIPEIEIVYLDEIYDNFGYGQPDPTSIRNYLHWARDHYNPVPSMVLLLGCGSYDYRNIENQDPFRSVVPVHEIGGKIAYFSVLNFNPCWDDWFVDFDGDRVQEMAISRITATSPVEAEGVVDKIIQYEQYSSFGDWRSRVMFLADDEYSSRVSQIYHEYIHTYQCESMVQQLSRYYQPIRLYLMNYLGTNQTAGPPYDYDPGDKPSASEDLMDQLNQGCIFWIFMGHGNLTVLTHESVFRHPSNTNAMENQVRGAVAFFGSCGVGAFDRTSYSSLADGIQLSPNSGTIYSWGSTRETYPSDNYPLALGLMGEVLNNGFSTGEAGFIIKNQGTNAGWKYMGFGDPASIVLTDTGHLDMSLYTESEVRSLSEVSGSSLEYSRGSGIQLNTSSAGPDQLVEVDTVNNQQLYVLEGEIPGGSFGEGWVGLIVVPPQRPDSHDYIHRTVPLSGDFLHYTSDQFIPGLSIYQGIFPVEDGCFEVSFTTPAGIDSSNSGSNCRNFMIYAYAWNNHQEARGYLELPSSGEDMGLSGDSAAPQVYLISGGRVISDSGEVVGDPMKAELVMEDPSGINLTPMPDYVMVMQIDDGELDTMLSREFVYDMGSTTRGRVKREIDFEDDGEHEILLVVSDNVGNRGYYNWYLEVEGGVTPELSQVMNYPNPMEESTDFTFILTSGIASVSIEIYTIGGRMIREIGPVEVSSGFNAIHWEGRDEEGDQPSNGVYFYRIVADWSDPESPGSEKELVEIEKLFICR
jgi:hypothetical protein